MSCHTGEVVASTQGWDLRAGTLISLPCTTTLEVIRCREGEMLPPAASVSMSSNWNFSHTLCVFDMFACQVGDGRSRSSSSWTTYPEEF